MHALDWGGSPALAGRAAGAAAFRPAGQPRPGVAPAPQCASGWAEQPRVQQAARLAVAAAAVGGLVSLKGFGASKGPQLGGGQGGGGAGGTPGGKATGTGGGGGGGGSTPQAGSLGKREEEERRRGAQPAGEQKPLPPVTLTLVSFAVTRKAYEYLTARFAKEYQEKTGQFVKFRLSFGGSGTQARAVIDGLPGDIVALALPLDVDKICEAGLITPGWRDRVPNRAVVAESAVAIVTRAGNPLRIREWDDLTRPDVSVITANPKTAGVARWNFLALWGHKMGEGDGAATAFLTRVFDRVPIQPRDAREASDVFYKQGRGDALLNYENEVIATNRSYGAAEALPYVVPCVNVRVQTPVAIVDQNVDRRSAKTKAATRAAAEAFVAFLFTAPAQEAFLAAGFRPVHPAVAKKCRLPKVKRFWLAEDHCGDWDAIQRKFFNPNGVLDQVERTIAAKRRAAAKK